MNISDPVTSTDGPNDLIPTPYVTTGILHNASTHGPADERIISREDETSQSSDETEKARLDRLGRERPSQFNSALAEYLFCYSILASQFMAASIPSSQELRSLGLMILIGILRIRLQRHSANAHRKTRHSDRSSCLAGRGLRPCRIRLRLAIRSSCRHVRRLSGLSLRTGMVLHLVSNRRIFPKSVDA